MILQSDLERYRELKAASAEAAGWLEQARRHIIREFPEGVEDGPCKVKVETRETRTFSYIKLVDIIGMKSADEVKALIAPTASIVVTVTGPS